MARTNITYITVLFAAIVTVGSCKYCSLKFQDCDSGGSKYGKLLSVQINETCNSEKAGVLEKGTNVSINFTFIANSDESTLTSKVFGKASVTPFFIPFPLGNPDACHASGLTCPIKANTKYQYLPQLEIKSSYPAVDVVVKWELQDSNENNIFCILMVAKISDKL